MEKTKRNYVVPEDLFRRQEALMKRQVELMEDGATLTKVETPADVLYQAELQKRMRDILDDSSVQKDTKLQVLSDLLYHYQKLAADRTVSLPRTPALPAQQPPQTEDADSPVEKNWGAEQMYALVAQLPATKRLLGNRFLRQIMANHHVQFTQKGELIGDDGKALPGATVSKLMRFFTTRHGRNPDLGEQAMIQRLSLGNHRRDALSNRTESMVYPGFHDEDELMPYAGSPEIPVLGPHTPVIPKKRRRAPDAPVKSEKPTSSPSINARYPYQRKVLHQQQRAKSTRTKQRPSYYSPSQKGGGGFDGILITV